jgi:hypothetical protein
MNRNWSPCSHEIFCLEMLVFRFCIYLLFLMSENELCGVLVIFVQGNTRNLQARQKLFLSSDRDHITHYWIHFHSISNSLPRNKFHKDAFEYYPIICS